MVFTTDQGCSMLFGVVWWFVWIVLLPRYKGFEYVDEVDVLDDGTVITRLVRKYP